MISAIGTPAAIELKRITARARIARDSDEHAAAERFLTPRQLNAYWNDMDAGRFSYTHASPIDRRPRPLRRRLECA